MTPKDFSIAASIPLKNSKSQYLKIYNSPKNINREGIYLNVKQKLTKPEYLNISSTRSIPTYLNIKLSTNSNIYQTPLIPEDLYNSKGPMQLKSTQPNNRQTFPFSNNTSKTSTSKITKNEQIQAKNKKEKNK